MSKMIYVTAFAVLLLVFTAPLLYAFLFDEVVELRNVQNFKITINDVGQGREVHIHGLIFESSRAAKGGDFTVKGDTMNIIVTSTLATSGLSGTFDYKFEVPAGIKEITFGKKEIQVWP